MKCWTVFALVLGGAFVLSLGSLQLSAQVCSDDEGMVNYYRKNVTDLVETVRRRAFRISKRLFTKRS